MAAATLFAQPYWEARSAEGPVYVGAKLTVFEAGTATPVAVYHDADLSTPWDTPIETNGAGLSDDPIFVSPTPSLKLVATDADDVPLPGYPMDDWTPYVLES